jgi:putative phosphoribosyl transferase
VSHIEDGRFHNREHAADELANRLGDLKSQMPLILGIPRGAMKMAKIISERLAGDLDLLLVHKVGHPAHPEFGIASVTEEGDIYSGERFGQMGLSESDLRRLADEEIRKLREKREMYTPGRRAIDPVRRTCVIVDDGIATGVTMLAAVRSLKAKGAGRVIVAAPVASKEAVRNLEKEGADVRAVFVPEVFYAVGLFYHEFDQVSDEEVIDIMGGEDREVVIEESDLTLRARLDVPLGAKGLVIFAHGSGSGRQSPRNQYVASVLNEHGIATLLADLLSEEEALLRRNIFDIHLLAERVLLLNRWARGHERLSALDIGYFGASTGAGAALEAAAREPEEVVAVVSRGGRPDLAGEFLPRVEAPTLLIVGSRDGPVIDMNREAQDMIPGEKRLEIVEGAGHLFEEPGTLEEVAELAARWFVRHMHSRRRVQARVPRKSVKERRGDLR